LIRSLSAVGRDPSQMCHSVTSTQAGADRLTRSPTEGTRPVPMLAELVDAVVGVDTHRDTHQVEIALPSGAPIACTTISNDTSGYAYLLAWIVDHTPGPRLAVSIEGTHSYRIGRDRALPAH